MSSPIITASLLPLLIMGSVLIFSGNYSTATTIYAQYQSDMSESSLLGVNITSPQKGQEIPVGLDDLTIFGKSTDKPTADDCQVSVIVNNVKPYQPAIANGTTGENNDYSRWFFILTSGYTSIKEGVNKITSKLECSPTGTGDDNTTKRKWYSINVTGTTTDEIAIPPDSHPIINSSTQVEPNNNNVDEGDEGDDVQEHVESNTDEEQEVPVFDTNNEQNIKEEIESLRERIMEQVKERLDEKDIEFNLPSLFN